MVIQDNRKGQTFASLKPGQIFEYEGEVLIKTRTIHSTILSINAIELSEGIGRAVDNTEAVMPLTAKLIIE